MPQASGEGTMSDVNLLFAVTGAVAVIYGLLLLWSSKQVGKDLAQQQWLKSEEVVRSRFNTLQHMRYFLRPERQNISFSGSKTRAYAMLAIGIALVVMAFT
jgi:hypothetical protein